MFYGKLPYAMLLCGRKALTACTDPAQLGGGTGGTGQNTQQGLLIGAAAGAALGALTGRDGDRTEAALKGGLLGAAAGGVIGSRLDAQEADLRESLGNDNVTIQNTGESLIVTLPHDILFATDSATLRPDLQRDLRSVAANLQAYPDTTVQIIGHTDSDGDAGYNQSLSEQRATSVAGVLFSEGVPARRVQTFGLGETQPVASNLSPEGKRLNRRVEIVIIPNAA